VTIEDCYADPTFQGFDRIARARIFLDHFPRSPLRPKFYCCSATPRRSSLQTVSRRRTPSQRRPRRRAGIQLLPELHRPRSLQPPARRVRLRQVNKRFHYDGAAWRELIRRYPRFSRRSPKRKQARLLYSQLRMSSIAHDTQTKNLKENARWASHMLQLNMQLDSTELIRRRISCRYGSRRIDGSGI
jgi:hypothetical protein